MSTLVMLLVLLGTVASIYGLIALIVALLRKKSVRKWFYILMGGIAAVAVGVLLSSIAVQPHLTVTHGAGDVSSKGVITANQGIIKGTAKNVKYVAFESDGIVWKRAKVSSSGKWVINGAYSGGSKYGRIFGTNEKIKETSDYKATTPTIKLAFTKKVYERSAGEVASRAAESSSKDSSSSSASSAPVHKPSIDDKIAASLKQDQGFAAGKLDSNGHPTTNGTPNSAYDWSTYVYRITYSAKNKTIKAYFNTKWNVLTKESKQSYALLAQNLVVNTLQEQDKATKKQVSEGIYTALYSGKIALGRSTLSDYRKFTLYR